MISITIKTSKHQTEIVDIEYKPFKQYSYYGQCKVLLVIISLYSNGYALQHILLDTH